PAAEAARSFRATGPRSSGRSPMRAPHAGSGRHLAWNTARPEGHAPQMDGFIGPDLEAIAGKGPGLAGSALRQYVCAIGVRRRLPRGADLPDRMQTGSRVRPGLRSCAKG